MLPHVTVNYRTVHIHASSIHFLVVWLCKLAAAIISATLNLCYIYTTQIQAVKKGTLSVKYHYFYSDRRCDGCCSDCEYRFYACVRTHCYVNDISGSRGYHRGREVNEGRFNQINTQPWTMNHPVRLQLHLEQHCIVSMVVLAFG